MTTCQARKIRKGITMADMCWDLTKYGGTANMYFLDTVDGTRIAMGRLSQRAFNHRLNRLIAVGKVAVR